MPHDLQCMPHDLRLSLEESIKKCLDESFRRTPCSKPGVKCIRRICLRSLYSYLIEISNGQLFFFSIHNCNLGPDDPLICQFLSAAKSDCSVCQLSLVMKQICAI